MNFDCPFKKKIIGWIIVVFFFSVIPASEDVVIFSLPFRVFEGKKTLLDLQQGDLELIINNQSRSIKKLDKNVASLSVKPDFLGRNLVLSFQISDFGKNIQQAISYFISEILHQNDRLIILSSWKIYHIRVLINKTKMIRGIKKLLERDCLEYRKRFLVDKKNLERRIARLNRLFRGGVDDDFLITSYKMIFQFLSNFPQEFLNYRKQYLSPGVDKYQKVINLLSQREGERWWIHFQQGENYRILSKIQNLLRKIHSLYADKAPAVIYQGLRQLEKHLEIGTIFPYSQLLNIFVNGRIRYNIIFWEEQSGDDSGLISNPFSSLEKAYMSITRQTGGMTIYSIEPETGLRKIRNHQDQFYQLVFQSNGIVENKKIQLFGVSGSPEEKKKTTPVYNWNFSKNEVQKIIDYKTKEKIKIVNLYLERNLLEFKIELSSIKKAEDFGLIKVRVELKNNPGENCVFRSENILRSSDRIVTVTLSFPDKYTGIFNLLINVCDLKENQLDYLETQISL